MFSLPLNANEYLFIDEVDNKFGQGSIGQFDTTTEKSFDQQPDRG